MAGLRGGFAVPGTRMLFNSFLLAAVLEANCSSGINNRSRGGEKKRRDNVRVRVRVRIRARVRVGLRVGVRFRVRVRVRVRVGVS